MSIDNKDKTAEIMSIKSKKNMKIQFSSKASMLATTTTLFCIIIFLRFSSASAYSSELILPQVSVGRNLLQTVKDCPVDVQNWNYTIVTSQCKGPNYPADRCCNAFKELACPYTTYLNDLTSNCATTMFSYINLYGNYPPGLFANTCHDSKRGLECTNAQRSDSSNTTSASSTTIARPTPTIALFFFFPILSFIFF